MTCDDCGIAIGGELDELLTSEGRYQVYEAEREGRARFRARQVLDDRTLLIGQIVTLTLPGDSRFGPIGAPWRRYTTVLDAVRIHEGAAWHETICLDGQGNHPDSRGAVFALALLATLSIGGLLYDGRALGPDDIKGTAYVAGDGTRCFHGITRGQLDGWYAQECARRARWTAEGL